MQFQAFARFNGGFRFSSRPPHGRSIYLSLREGMGDTYETDWEGRQQKRLFAQSMALAAAQYQNDRAIANANPATATELLPQHERDSQIVAEYGATLAERRATADLRRKVTRGARREAVEDTLRTLLGDAFIAYEATAASDAIVYPDLADRVGVFEAPGTAKKLFSIDANIARTEVPLTVPYTSLGGTEAPMPGEAYTVDPDLRMTLNAERVVISAVGAGTITATFARAHVRGVIATRPHPAWISSKRYNRIIVTFEAATNPETRRKINEVMARQLRGVSQWCIVQEDLFHLNVATPGSARLGATRLH